MTSIRIADSLRYGAKLFAFFLLVALLGGGGMIVGAALAVPELQTYLDGGGVETGRLAGGAILATLGVVAWVSGTFAVAYKLIGDAVAEGLRAGQLSAPAAAGTGDDQGASEAPTEEHGPSPGGQAAEERDPGQPAPEAPETDERAAPAAEPVESPPDEPARPAATAERPSTEAAGPAEGATEPAGPAREGTESVGTVADQEPSWAAEESKPEAARERTAEEIAFGTAGDREESAAAEPNEDSTAADDESTVEDFEGDAESDTAEDVEADETLADEQENVEPANKSGADPLADFDEG